MIVHTLRNATITITDQTGASVSLPLESTDFLSMEPSPLVIGEAAPIVFADLPPISFTLTDVRWARDRRGTRKQRRLTKVRRMQRHRKIDRRLDRLDEMQRRFLRDASYPMRYNPDVGP